jgi:hypothetical protein
MRTITLIRLGALALGVVLAVPAFAQEVWQTYPMTISTPAFGPGPVKSFQAPAAQPAARQLYNVVPSAQGAGPRCEAWQTYPMTISTPADYDATACQ